MDKLKLAIIGNTAQDITAYVEINHINFEGGFEYYPSKDITSTVGGCSINIAQAVIANGCDIDFHSMYSDDDIGKILLNQLQHKKIGVSHIYPLLQGNNRTLLIVNKDGNKVMFSHPASLPTDARIKESFINKLEKYAYLHIVLNSWNRPLIHSIHEMQSDISLSTDLHMAVDELEIDILSSMDIVFFSGTSRTDQHDIINKILGYGPKIVVCTMGSEGCIVGTNEGVIDSYKAISQSSPIVDTIGAGDVFAGTFLSEYYRHSDIKTAVIKASIQAGDSCTKYGLEDLLNEDELERRYVEVSYENER